jgi:succinoglycan biosynthesis protein ExoV
MLYYCRTQEGNFGDDLNPWLWSRMAPELILAEDPRVFVGIGTLLSHNLPKRPVKFIFGPGCGYSRRPTIDGSYRFYAVRGPLTVSRLGLDPGIAQGDPAILLRALVDAGERPKIHRVSFMPHHKSMVQADWARLCKGSVLNLIDPCGPVEQVLAQIRGSELLLAEAMHGAIVADALRVPWLPVRMYSPFLEFKWQDWAGSLGLCLSIMDVPPVFQRPLAWSRCLKNAVKASLARAGAGKKKWNRLQLRLSRKEEEFTSVRVLEELARTARPCLSRESALASAEERLLASLDRLRRDWRECA